MVTLDREFFFLGGGDMRKALKSSLFEGETTFGAP